MSILLNFRGFCVPAPEYQAHPNPVPSPEPITEKAPRSSKSTNIANKKPEDIKSGVSRSAHPHPPSPHRKALLRKQDNRIVPLSAAIYFLCHLDRSNIGNAKILNSDSGHGLLTETGMTSHQFTISLMIFFVAYGLFEVPSNIPPKRLRPSC
ncbi:hypothetical protein B0T22DRAFT_515544 [Podospora appendiculata]|uniref:Transporter n=1 Tax=Podospora appendiculata TaxID=314037 RepID=A0AAE1CED2_9PEZI|nr:hypothetical protein B0T22DRAFT_515544 [Podospora appendiculata]